MACLWGPQPIVAAVQTRVGGRAKANKHIIFLWQQVSGRWRFGLRLLRFKKEKCFQPPGFQRPQMRTDGSKDEY